MATPPAVALLIWAPHIDPRVWHHGPRRLDEEQPLLADTEARLAAFTELVRRQSQTS